METAGEPQIDKDKKQKGEGGESKGKMEGEDRWSSAGLRSVLGNAGSPGD